MDMIVETTMSTTGRINNASVVTAPARAYITTGEFAERIFSYATSFNSSTYQTTGTLTALGEGSGTNEVAAAINVAGIVLRESGKKLYVGANPGVPTYMVSVYYPGDGTNAEFKGFIDPNDSVFAPFNTDKPYFLEDALSFTVDGDGVATTGAADEGAPVYTAGDITTTGGDVIVEAGNVNVTGNVAATGTILSSGASKGIGYATGAGATGSDTGSTVTLTGNKMCGQVSFGTNINNGDSANFTVNGVGSLDANDVVIVSQQTGRDVLHSVKTVGSGTFTIRVTNNSGADISDDFTFNFAVIKSVTA